MEEPKPYALCKQCALRRKECTDKDDVKWLVGCDMFVDKVQLKAKLKREKMKNEKIQLFDIPELNREAVAEVN